jgi:hypothetical protein
MQAARLNMKLFDVTSIDYRLDMSQHLRLRNLVCCQQHCAPAVDLVVLSGPEADPLIARAFRGREIGLALLAASFVHPICCRGTVVGCCATGVNVPW